MPLSINATSGYSFPGSAGGGTDPVITSTLGTDTNQADGYAYAPTLSIVSGVVAGVWSTVGRRVSDDTAVTVGALTTVNPTATLTAADITAGDSFRMTSTYTEPAPSTLSTTYTSIVRIAGTGGGAALDADTDTPAMTTPIESLATTGSTLGTVAFRGPTEASGASLGGPDAAFFTLSGGGTGTVTILAASDLAANGGSGGAGQYQFTLTVGGYTTATIELTVLPEPSAIGVQSNISTADGYMLQRRNGGPWGAYSLGGTAAYDWRGLALADFDVDPTVPTVAITGRIDTTIAAESYWTATPNTGGWAGVNLFSGNGVTCAAIDSTAEYGMLGLNKSQIKYKTLATIASGGWSGASQKNLWSGVGGATVQALHHRPSTGQNFVAGYSGAGAGIATIYYIVGNPGGTWTVGSPGAGWTTGAVYGIGSSATNIVLVGTTSRSAPVNGKIAYSTDDGVTFTDSDFAGVILRAVAYSVSLALFVAVGDGGVIYTSADPSAGWTARTSGTVNTLLSVVFDLGSLKFVAVGASGTILESADGITWSAVAMPAGPGATATLRVVASTTFPV
jgi:hypothetical protein